MSLHFPISNILVIWLRIWNLLELVWPYVRNVNKNTCLNMHLKYLWTDTKAKICFSALIPYFDFRVVLTLFWICARFNYFAMVTRIRMNIYTFTHMFYFAHWSFVFNKLVFKRQMLVIVVVCGSASVKWILTLLFKKVFITFVPK